MVTHSEEMKDFNWNEVSLRSLQLKWSFVFDDAFHFITAHILILVFPRQLEQEMETVVKVLQPGPLGIIEHKFSTEEIREAEATVNRAVANWRRNANLEQGSDILKSYIHKWWIFHYFIFMNNLDKNYSVFHVRFS